jgi:hypothetical protein
MLNRACCAHPDRSAFRRGARGSRRPYGTCVDPASHDEAARARSAYCEPDRSSFLKSDEQETASVVTVDTPRWRPRKGESSLAMPEPPRHLGSTRSLPLALEERRALFICEAEIHTLTVGGGLSITSLPETETRG